MGLLAVISTRGNLPSTSIGTVTYARQYLAGFGILNNLSSQSFKGFSYVTRSKSGGKRAKPSRYWFDPSLTQEGQQKV